jgi:hypothetical protein
MFVCVYPVFVEVAALRRVDPHPRSPTDYLRIKKLKKSVSRMSYTKVKATRTSDI